jgi:glucokinase
MAQYSIGVDLGGTNLRIAAFNLAWERLESVAIATRVSHGPQAVLADMAQAIRRVIDSAAASGHAPGELVGIGIGSPGPIELPEGRLLSPPNLPGFDQLELKIELEKLLGLPVIIECDANAAALAEAHGGLGREYGVDSLCMVTLGTGVGGGIVIGGKIWHGFNGMAGEVGHVSVWADGIVCSCGNRGCLELFGSATGIARMAREAAAEGRSPRTRELIDRGQPVTARDVARFAEQGDAGALAAYDTCGRALGLGLADMVNTLNLPLYTVGGGAAAAWPLFSPVMFRELERASYVYRLTKPADPSKFERGKTNIMPARLGSDSGLLGAAMVPCFQL